MTVADNEGIKPIDLAREHGFEDCVFELFRAAKTNIVVRDGLMHAQACFFLLLILVLVLVVVLLLFLHPLLLSHFGT